MHFNKVCTWLWAGFQGQRETINEGSEKGGGKWVEWTIHGLVPQALCEPEEEEDVDAFLRAVEGRDRRQRRTWLLCVSSRQPEIQVIGECTHTLECRVK